MDRQSDHGRKRERDYERQTVRLAETENKRAV